MADKSYAMRGGIAVAAGVGLVLLGVFLVDATQTPEEAVVAVKAAMHAGTVLQPADLISVSIPQSEAQIIGAIPYTSAPLTATGTYLLRSSVQPGEILVQPMVGQRKAAPIPRQGMVAMNFPVQQAAGVGFYSGEQVAVVGIPSGSTANNSGSTSGSSSSSSNTAAAAQYLPTNKAVVFINKAKIVAVYSNNNTQIDTIGGGQAAQAAQVEMTGVQFKRLLPPLGQGWNLELVANTGGLTSTVKKSSTNSGAAGSGTAAGGTAVTSAQGAAGSASSTGTAPSPLTTAP